MRALKALAANFMAAFTAVLLGVPVVGARAADVPPVPQLSPIADAKLAEARKAFGRGGVEYLESLKGKVDSYQAPSEIDPRYTIALYVNASGGGDTAQRMWVLHRDKIGGAWRVGMWDENYWRRKGLPDGMEPPYSWPVSTGRKYRGDRFSGPTPTGVFSLDERKYRMARGYTSPGMINVMYIDLHYSSGRRSGVAFHGTTTGRYRRLGSIDSHGCIRMTKANALDLLNRLQGRDGVLSEEMRWGAVPRYWKTESGSTRRGYTRDGTPHPVEVEETADNSDTSATLSDATQFPQVLTKNGYRAISIIFQD